VTLVLSLFPGLGILDHAFELEGFTTVRGPDMIWGGDIRTFHPPPGRFDGVIGGDPCQSHSSLANLVRAKGLEPSFPDMTGEFQRVVEEARPAWFLRENVPKAPDIKPAGYSVRSFLFDNWASLGEEQMRRRRFWFGVREGECPELRRWIEYALVIPGEPALASAGNSLDLEGGWQRRQSISGDARAVSVKLGGSGKVKKSTVQAPGKGYSTRYTLAEMLELQGLPPTFLDHCPMTVQGKRKAIGNGVAVPTGRALARAIQRAMG
jgi:DNA (cytosine-5)-methyltransferase 1